VVTVTDLRLLWDSAYDDWRQGMAIPSAPVLQSWYRAYTAKDPAYCPQPDFFAEPYFGRLGPGIRAATLGLNPGPPKSEMQSRDGLFAEEIAAAGSDSSWASGWPYVGNTSWTRRYGKNAFHSGRFSFLRDVFGTGLRTEDVTCFELYPWHSAGFNRHKFRFDRAPLRELVWEPLEEMGSPPVFAFGQTLFDLLRREAADVVAVLGRGGEPVNLGVDARRVLVAVLPGGSLAIAESTGNYFVPPKPVDRRYVIREVDRVLEQAGLICPWRM
jgi:hypothetical protein